MIVCEKVMLSCEHDHFLEIGIHIHQDKPLYPIKTCMQIPWNISQAILVTTAMKEAENYNWIRGNKLYHVRMFFQ